ncbi:phosphopantetheine-binding protein [Kitasatospora sp. NPDC058048]|uniref:phosphopantetheine-binding protein n=1 Tax=Kitasatospora sp. NPDC058048 TaxID=3346313 RepID=UPI0036DC2E46
MTDETRQDRPWDTAFEELLLRTLPRLAARGPLTGDASLRAAGLDSLAMVELLVQVEQLYGIGIPDGELVSDTFSTPDRLWNVVSALRAGRTADPA